MRTVEDLREALVSLEDEAPAVNVLLLKSSRATRHVERRPRRWVLPALAAGLTIAVVLGVAEGRSGSGPANGASHKTNGAAAGGPSRLLPFRLTNSLPQLTLLDVHSDATSPPFYGTAVLAEYGMEVTIDVRTARGHPTRSASASGADVAAVEGWIDTSCGVRAAPSSVPPLDTSDAGSTAPDFNPTCSLTYDSGPWSVAIYVAGPGGGSRKITAEQFLQIEDRLQLADSPADPSSWFASNELLPG
jgi:hypothetical protein